MQLEQLNDDCLEIIFQMLSLGEQMTVVLVSPRLRDIIKSMWRRRYRQQKKLTISLVYSPSIETFKFQKSQEGLAEFASVVCEYVEEMTISDAPLLKLLATHKWPKLKYLKANVKGSTHESGNPAEIFEKFPVLENLKLSWGVKFYDYSYRYKLRASLRESSTIKMGVRRAELCLEEEDIAREFNQQILRSDFFLQRMRTLHCAYNCGYRDMEEYIQELRHHAERMQAMTAKKCEIVKAINFKKLRKLDISGFSIKDLCFDEMPLLEELHFRNPRMNMAVADLKDCRDFFVYASECVDRQAREKKRHKPLTVFSDVHYDLQFMLNLNDLPEMLRIEFGYSPRSGHSFMLRFYLNMPWENVLIE